MGGGGKGGKETKEVKLPPELQYGASSALGGALSSAGLDYAPNRGVTLAAFSPQQRAAFEGANQAAAAFGLPTGQGQYMPAPETGAGGVQGYSTGALYDQHLNASMTPEQLAERQAILDSYSQSGNTLRQHTLNTGIRPSSGGGGK